MDGALELEPAQGLGPGLQPQAPLGQGSAPLFGRTRGLFEQDVYRSEDSGDSLLPILGLELVDQLQNARWVGEELFQGSLSHSSGESIEVHVQEARNLVTGCLLSCPAGSSSRRSAAFRGPRGGWSVC